MASELIYVTDIFHNTKEKFTVVEEEPLQVLEKLFLKQRVMYFLNVKVDFAIGEKGFSIQKSNATPLTTIDSLVDHTYFEETKVDYSAEYLQDLYKQMIFNNGSEYNKDNLLSVFKLLGVSQENSLKDLRNYQKSLEEFNKQLKIIHEVAKRKSINSELAAKDVYLL
jgi:hypothetical protein